jgi:hypothetical protein
VAAEKTGAEVTKAADTPEGARRLAFRMTLRGFDANSVTPDPDNGLRNSSLSGAAQSGAVAEAEPLAAFIATLSDAQKAHLVTVLFSAVRPSG